MDESSLRRVGACKRQRLTSSPNENTVEGHIEYDISRSIAAEGTVGDRTQEISVLWTHDF